MDDTELAELAPILAERGEDEALVAVVHYFDDVDHGAGGEVDVVGLQDLSGGIWRRDDDVGGFAQLEVHDGAVGEREVAEDAVREGSEHVVHAADDGELPWARGETLFVMRFGSVELEDEDDDQGEEKREVEELH